MSIEELKYSEEFLPSKRADSVRSLPEYSTLVDVLRFWASRKPDHLSHIFLVDGENEKVSLTYAELERRAMSIAALLQGINAAGQRVLLLDPPGLEYIAAFFGCLYAGAVAVPAYPPRMNRSFSRLQEIVNDAQPVAALTTASILDKVDKLFDQAPELKKLSWITTDNVSSKYAKHWREPRIDGSTLAFLQYTSGSTSTPKGVMVSHGNLLNNQRTIRAVFKQNEESIIVGWLPLYHDMGLIGNMLQPLFLGAQCILMSPVAFLQRPVRWLQAISDYRATTSGGPNFAFDLCVKRIAPEERELLDLSSWSVAFNGAEPIRANTLNRFAKAFGPCGFSREAFYPCYGLAEATLLVSGKQNSGPPVIRQVSGDQLKKNRVAGGENGEQISLVSSGASLEDILVVDPETSVPCSPDEVGEVWVSGPSVAQGYWNRPDESERTFKAQLAGTGAGPFLRTGDLGFISDGELFITGRLKDLMIFRGLNYYPQDIEATVEKAHEQLRPLGAAFSVTVDNEERLVVVQELMPRCSSSFPEISEAIVQAVAEEHELQVYALVLLKAGSIPMTSSGKIRRHECRSRFLGGTLDSVFEWRANVPAGSYQQSNSRRPFGSVAELEAWLKVTVAERLGLEVSRVDANQRLSTYAIDSLAAVELAHTIEATTGVSLSLATFLQQVSISELAVEISARAADSTNSISSDLPRAEYLPSFGQQALWFLQQLEPESSAYNIARALRFRGPLNRTALRQAFQECVNRHTVLRTAFLGDGQQPTCEVREGIEVSFLEEDASRWSEALLAERLSAAAHQPFDLQNDVLLRVSLFERSVDEHVLLLTVHHIAADLWSMGVLLKEVVLSYEAALSGNQPVLPPLALEYADYTQWQRRMLEGEEGEKLWSYWRDKLSFDLPVVELPTDKPRPAVQTLQGKSHSFKLPRELTRRLKALSGECGATLYMTLLASFEVFLYHYTGQKDIVVGSPVSGRSRVDFKKLVGYFVNPLVMRADLSGQPSFTSFLEQVRQTTLDALVHQELPFPLLVERLQPDRDLSRSPLFQIMFVMQNMQSPGDIPLSSFALGAPGVAVTMGPLTFESVPLEQRIAQFDLTLMMAETGDELSGCFEYSTDLFDSHTIESMVTHFCTLLQSVADFPERRVSEYSLLAPAERRQLLVEWNSDQIQPSSPAVCIHQLFEAQIVKTPAATALVCGEESLSYAELDQRAEQLAARLRGLGVGPEVRVGICLGRTVEMVVALLAVLKAGGAYVPLDPGYPEERLSYMLADSGAAVVLTEAGYGERLRGTETPKLYLDAAAEPVREGQQSTASTVSGSNLAYVIYTSGSTGQPKGVGIEHHSAVAFLEWARRQFASEQMARTLAGTSICFDLSVFEIFAPLSRGGTVVLVENVLAVAAEDWTKEAGLTLVNTVPSALAELLRLQALPETVGTVNLAGEALSGVLVQQLYEQSAVQEVYNLYGPTEDTTYSTVQLVRGNGEAPSIGRAIAQSRAYVLNEQLGVCPVGVIGELYLSGAGVARGYLGQAARTAERFVPDPYSAEAGERMYRTGDRARWLSRGELEFLGRADQQVKLRGYRIELGEIEEVLRQHEQVQEAVVQVRGDQLDCYVVGAADVTVQVEELQRYLEERLPGYMVPSGWQVLAEMPLTPNGKLDRRRLAGAAVAKTGEYVGPRNATEAQVAQIWSEVLRLERVGVEENFFTLGGHSLLATQVVSRLRQEFGLDIALRSMFEAPTVARLAQKIDTLSGSEQRALKPQVTRVERTCGTDGAVRMPMSFGQERLWFLHQLDPESSAYNMSALARLKGALDVRALEESLNEIIRRHEVLRTRFVVEDGKPLQVIVPHLVHSFTSEDLHELDESQQRAELSRIAAEEAHWNFDLSQLPLLRSRLLKLKDDEHLLLLTTHHIMWDGWSTEIFLAELAHNYEAFTSEKPSLLPELAIQYSDFAAWQLEWSKDQAVGDQLEYWKQQLANIPTVIDLPLDRPRAAVQSYRSGQHSFTWSPSLSKGLTELGGTLFTALLAGLQALLYRYTNQKTIVVGTPFANRNQKELEALIGFFVNTLAVRTDVSPGTRFAELISQVRETALDAYAHQDLPFERLVEELQPERNLSHTPIFQVMLALQSAAKAPARFKNLELEFSPNSSGIAKFDLLFYFAETDRGLTGELEYNLDIFDSVTIERLVTHFENLLLGAVANPDLSLFELPLIDEAEAEQVLVTWNPSQAVLPAPPCIHHLVEEQVVKTPARTALLCGEESLSYTELDQRAEQLAARLRALGVGPEVRVGICLGRTVEMVVALLAVLKAGGAYVPLDPGYPEERLSYMLADSGAAVVLTESSYGERLRGTETRKLYLDAAAEPVSEGQQSTASTVSGSNLAYVIYTSGSTGQPKGVGIEHHSAVAFLEWARRQFASEQMARTLAGTSICFDLSVFEIFAPLSRGGTVVLVENVLAVAAEDWTKEAGLTLVNTVPSALAELLRLQALPETVGTVNLAGEALSGVLVQQLYEQSAVQEVYNLYGPTEDTTYSTVQLVRGNGEAPSIGRAIAQSRAYVLNEQLGLCPVGVIGELYLSGAGVARGYLGQAARTAERFVPDPYSAEAGERMYRTGDRARWLSRGELEFLGRADQQVKLRGYRIELGEIEEVLRQHEQVQEAVVQVRGDQLDCYVVGAADVTVQVEELQRYLEERLPGYMVPSGWQVLAEMPLTPNGKLDRRRLAGAAVAKTGEYVAARNATEAQVAQIWSEVLRLERVGVEENFFTLGGHSLLATQVVSRLRQEFGLDIALRSMFEAPTVARLAHVIEQLQVEQKDTTLPAMEAVSRGDGSFQQLVSHLQSLSAEDVKNLLSQKRSTLNS